MEPEKLKHSSVQQIQDAQKAQKKLIDDLRKKQWGDLSTGTDEIQIINTQNVDKAKQGLADLDREETAAYGLGDGGYWNENRKLDDDVNSIGQQPRMPSQEVVQPTRNSSTSYTPPKSNWEADDWAMRGKAPTERQKPKPAATVKPYDPSGMKPLSYYSTGRDDVSKGAQKQKELQITQKQDEIVHGQNLSETKQGKLKADLQKLNAEKSVIEWQQQNPNATEEDFDAKRRYYDEMHNRAADDYLNEWGGKDTAEAKEAWAAYGEQVDELVEQRDAKTRAAKLW